MFWLQMVNIKNNFMKLLQILTLDLMSSSRTYGTMIPAKVPIPLDIPISILAYLGAISK